ncbi:hypothetical protein LSAT2_012198, partial [Lamellibrachia satsuma]
MAMCATIAPWRMPSRSVTFASTTMLIAEVWRIPRISGGPQRSIWSGRRSGPKCWMIQIRPVRVEKPAALYDTTNPDWTPSLRFSYTTTPTTPRYARNKHRHDRRPYW